MNKYKEYTGFRKDNEQLLSLLKKNNSKIYDYFLDAFKVLGHIELLSDRDEVDSDLEAIFDATFPFLFESFETVKAFYEGMFDKDYEKLKKYEGVITYYLFVEDLLMALEAEKKYQKYVSQVEEILQELDDILVHNKSTSGVVDKMNTKLELVAIKDRPMTMHEILGEIVDELNL